MTALAEFQLLESEGRYFDGVTARPTEVIVKFGDASLMVMSLDEVPLTHWPLASLRAVAAREGALTLAPDHESDERLTVAEPMMIDAISRVCPDLHKPRTMTRRRWGRALLWAGAAVAAVYLVVFHIVPGLADQMAELIPPEAEVAMGEAMVDDVVAIVTGARPPKFCTGEAGRAALARMTERLEAAAPIHVPLTVQVVRARMVNAFALPGGQIVLFEGLLKATETPEELAGVLAHEMAHVANRDPTRLTLRSAGAAGVLGLLLGDFTGAGVAVALSEALIRSGYQRDAEAAADEFALTLLTREGLPTEPFAGFFRKLDEKTGDGEGADGLLSHLATHPDLGARAARAAAADRVGAAPFAPILSDRDWVALRGICG